MDPESILLTLLLLAPPIAIGAFWRASLRRGRRTGALPDAEAVVLARVGGILCTLLPILQLGASIIRYKTGGVGLYLWYLLPGFGVLLAAVVLAALLTHARGRERAVSSGMVLLSVCMLLLITFVAGSPSS